MTDRPAERTDAANVRPIRRAASEASPWKLGGLSPLQLARRVYDELWADEVLDRAAALSYYFLFALFPALLFLTALLGLVSEPQLMDQLVSQANQVLPEDAASLLTRTLGEVRRGGTAGLVSLGALLALWAASSGMASVMAALNVAYEVDEPRPWWKRRLLALALTVGFSLFTVTALLLLVFGPRIGEAVAGWVGLGGVFTALWNVLRWPVLIALVLTAIALVYYLAPAARQRWRWVTPGSVVAVALWLAASIGLRAYVRNFGDYGATYGSLGGVILLVLWLYVSSVVLLLGAEVNSEIEQAAAERGHPDAKGRGERQPGKPGPRPGRLPGGRP
ncbi:MAG: YihY/virulence factor BrkB family protein [Candidatus Rokuibacteriota bacterium]